MDVTEGVEGGKSNPWEKKPWDKKKKKALLDIEKVIFKFGAKIVF